ncbi:hypothetical protein RHODOSMS8_00023 [Rhodobiaceae bacterium]|nr:hypothetical protein RHODOSMS8_00023 [Rhodobiaceae bacterium]
MSKLSPLSISPTNSRISEVSKPQFGKIGIAWKYHTSTIVVTRGGNMAEHYFHLLKAGMGRRPAVDVTVTLQDFVATCKHYHEKKETVAFIAGASVKTGNPDDQSNAIYIADLDDNDKYFSVLLIRGNPDKALPGFVNPTTQEISVIETTEEGFVPGTSCHIVISKQEIAGTDAGRYPMAMEQTPGISRILARDYFAKLLVRYAEDHPDKYTAKKKVRSKREKPEEILYLPTVRFHPQQNAKLEDDLKEGKIGGFKLKRGTKDFDGEADEPKINKLDVQLHARIVPTKEYSKVKSLIGHVREALGEVNFEDYQLELVDDDGDPIQNPRAAKLKDLDTTDMRYCKKVLAKGVTDKIPEIIGKLHPQLHAAAIKAISNKSNWS